MKKPVKITHTRPIDALLDRSKMRCTLCNALMGQCDCWTECPCGWSFQKSTACRNPQCSQLGKSGDAK